MTEEVVKGLPRPEQGNRVHYDEALAGFGARVTAAGSRSFVLNYVHRGRERRAAIGLWPSWGVRAAREEAQRMRRAVDVGDDPLADRDARARRPPSPTSRAGMRRSTCRPCARRPPPNTNR